MGSGQVVVDTSIDGIKRIFNAIERAIKGSGNGLVLHGYLVDQKGCSVRKYEWFRGDWHVGDVIINEQPNEKFDLVVSVFGNQYLDVMTKLANDLASSTGLDVLVKIAQTNPDPIYWDSVL